MKTWKWKKTANLRSVLIFWTYLSRRVVSLVRVQSLKRAKNVSLPRLGLFQITTAIIFRNCNTPAGQVLSTTYGFCHSLVLSCRRLSFHLAVSWCFEPRQPHRVASPRRGHQETPEYITYKQLFLSPWIGFWFELKNDCTEQWQTKNSEPCISKGVNLKSTTHTQSMRRGISPNRPGRRTDGARRISKGSFQNTKCWKPQYSQTVSFLWFKPKLGAVYAGAETSTVNKKNGRVYAIKVCSAFKISCQTWILDEMIIYVVWYLSVDWTVGFAG